MKFSRIRLRPDAAGNSAWWRRFCNVYAAHKTVWALFDRRNGSPREFLYRIDGNGEALRILTVSSNEPSDRENIFDIESKDYSPSLQAGDRLIFKLRVNPTVKISEKGQRQGKRHDAVMHLKRLRKARGQEARTDAALIEEAGWGWLEARATRHGFKAERNDVSFDGYRQVRTGKGDGPRAARISILDVDGLLTVTDPTLLVETLFRGIGSAKGFGCGLMLVRRA